MRLLGATLTVLLCVSVGLAQERIPQDQAVKYGGFMKDATAKLADLPVKTDPDPEKAFGMKKDDLGALVMPDRQLTAERLSAATIKVMPLGQLWTRNITICTSGTPLPNDKIRIVGLNADGQEHPLPLFLLGLRKKEGKLELLIYAKDKEPALIVPLEESSTQQEFPIQFESRDEGNDRGGITLSILGKYKANFQLAKQQ